MINNSPIFSLGKGYSYNSKHVESIFNYFNVEDKKYLKSKDYFTEQELSEKLISLGVDEKDTPSYLRKEYCYTLNDIENIAIFEELGVSINELINNGISRLHDNTDPKLLDIYKSFGFVYTEKQKNFLIKEMKYLKIKEKEFHEIPQMILI